VTAHQQSSWNGRVIGISGGSGSGKTTFAKALDRELHWLLRTEPSAILAQDSYYIDQSRHFRGDGENVNFDHPDSLDFPLMGEHLLTLRQGQPIEVPIYDFPTHTRSVATTPFASRPVIIVDGTLILTQPRIREQLDWSVFIQTSETTRFDRRFRRDMVERGRQPDGIRKQFERQVKPMHDLFVEPSRVHASEVLSGETAFDAEVKRWARTIADSL